MVGMLLLGRTLVDIAYWFSVSVKTVRRRVLDVFREGNLIQSLGLTAVPQRGRAGHSKPLLALRASIPLLALRACVRAPRVADVRSVARPGW